MRAEAASAASFRALRAAPMISTQLIALAILLVAPTCFWVAYHLYKDRHEPEPPLFLLLAYGLGLVGGVLADLAYQGLGEVGLRLNAFALAANGDRLLLFAYAILAIGVIEEGAKLLPFWLVGIRHHHFDEPIDGIIYASIVALGFATHENVQYLQYMSGWEALGRAFASPAVHILFASIWGHAAGRAHALDRSLVPTLPFAFVVAAIAHGIYDFLVIGFPDSLGIAAPLIIGAIWVWRAHLIERLHLDRAHRRLLRQLRSRLHREDR